MIDTLLRRKGVGAVRSPLDSDQHQDAAKAPFANFRSQSQADIGQISLGSFLQPVKAIEAAASFKLMSALSKCNPHFDRPYVASRSLIQ